MSDTAKSPSSDITTDIRTPNKNNNQSDKSDKVKLSWNDQTETLLRSWGDISSCYNWMHDKSFRKYQKKNFKFSLPVIILSTLTGTLNLALQGYVPAEYVTYAQAGIGGVNIFTGILTTLQNYFRYAENSESHRNASVGWGKLQRNISIELTYDRLSRKDADSFIKVCRMEYDRLLEQSPIIPTEIINLFKKKYTEQRKKKKEKRKSFTNPKSPKQNDDDEDYDDSDDDKLILPDVCGELTHTGVYKESLNECTRLDRLLDIKESEDTKLIPEIKDVLLDRLNMIEQRLSIGQTPKAEYKPLSEYSSEELKVALERKNITHNAINHAANRTHSFSQDTEQAIQKAIQKHIEPINLNIRRMSENLQKPVLSRVNTGYMADIPITQNKNRDFSFKDLMNRFQKDAPIPIMNELKEIKEEIKEEVKENIENKNIEKIILQENNLQEVENTINTINKIEIKEDIIPEVNITINESSKVLNDIVSTVKIDSPIKIIDNPLLEIKEDEPVVENLIPNNIDIDKKPKSRKNHVEINKGNPIGKNQSKLNSFFQPNKPKEEEIKIDIEEPSIILQEDSTTSETSTFEVSVNENGEESIKLNFVDTDDDEEDKK